MNKVSVGIFFGGFMTGLVLSGIVIVIAILITKEKK